MNKTIISTTLAISTLCFVTLSSAQETHQYNYSVQEHAHSDTVHHYASPADEAIDAALIAQVKAALADDGVLKGHAIVVDCDDGTCTLTGVVGSQEDAQHAVSVASDVNGVELIKSNLSW